MSDLDKMNTFLESIDLKKYRKKYSHIKLVELDLDRNIQALHHLYDEYWTKRDNFPSYDEFYEKYSRDLEDKLEAFRLNKMFSYDTFHLGLPARIYRTWASLLTQIQGGYAAEELYGRGNVQMSEPLDRRGIDIQILDGNETFNIQIKKESISREVRAPWQRTRYKEKITVVSYKVPGCDPITPKKREPSIPFQKWSNKWRGKLCRLDNGFIVFLPDMFKRDNIRVR